MKALKHYIPDILIITKYPNTLSIGILSLHRLTLKYLKDGYLLILLFTQHGKRMLEHTNILKISSNGLMIRVN